MPKTFIKDLKEGMNVDSVFLCSHKALLFGKNSKSYVNLRLLDRSGQVEARIWDQAETLAQNFEKFDYVRTKGRVVFYQDHLQFNVFEIQRINEGEMNAADFLPTTQKDIPRMYQELVQICRQDMKNPWVQQLLLSILEDPQTSKIFQRSPAAKTHHHAWVGGLLEHILGLCKLAKSALSHYPQINLDLVLAGMIMHDFGKIEEISADRLFEYTDKGRLIGHLIIGVEILIKKAALIPNFPEKILRHIEHIILSHHGRLEYGSPKLPMTLEALVVSGLDDLDSKIQGFCDLVARDGDIDSTWTPMNPLFDRPLYKKTQLDMEESLRQVSSEKKSEAKKRPSSKDPLKSNLGELLQQSLVGKSNGE
jgi:3'-5' exoribonuclease